MKIKIILLMCLSFSVFAEPVDINNASAKEIAASLSGIGEKKAQEIVKYRERNGNFKSIDELINVKGIGKKTIGNKDIIIKGEFNPSVQHFHSKNSLYQLTQQRPQMRFSTPDIS